MILNRNLNFSARFYTFKITKWVKQEPDTIMQLQMVFLKKYGINLPFYFHIMRLYKIIMQFIPFKFYEHKLTRVTEQNIMHTCAVSFRE